MEARKKRTRKRIVFGVFALLVIAGLTALPFILSEQQESKAAKASILSAQVKTGSIQKTLSGTGTLAEQEAQEVSVPQGVKVTEYLVANGQLVKAGDAVACVDRVSVMETISAVQEAMDEAAAELEAAGEGNYTFIYAPAPGRVKAVYASTGDAVQTVMERSGALAILSLDGLMAVQIPAAPQLSIGQALIVRLSDGTETAGRVESVNEETTVVTFSDRYGSIGETAEVRTEAGAALGSAAVYVHAAWKAMASSGTVYTVFASQNAEYWTGGAVLSIEGASDGSYESLLSEYRAYEELMAKLFRMYQDGVLQAPCDGYVSGVDETLIQALAADGEGLSIRLLANAPGEDPDAGYRNRIGMLTAVKEDGTATALMQSWDTEIPDYADLAFVVTAPESMTQSLSLTLPPVYRRDGESWVPMTELSRGDVFAFAYSGNLVWMVYVGHNTLPETSEDTEPAEEPESGGSRPGGTGGGMPSMSGGKTAGGASFAAQGQQSTQTRYAIRETSILSVTPQETMTVSMTVDELDILAVHTGAQALVTLDALPGQSFSGVIRDVNTTASNEGGHSKYTAVVELRRTGNMLSGMNASVSITVETRDGILTIPAEALTEQDGRAAVYTGYDAKSETLAAPVTVETGLSDGLQVQILSGLSEGDTVWYAYYDTLEISGLTDGIFSSK